MVARIKCFSEIKEDSTGMLYLPTSIAFAIDIAIENVM